jgi:hypothetical protein
MTQVLEGLPCATHVSVCPEPPPGRKLTRAGPVGGDVQRLEPIVTAGLQSRLKGAM